MAESRRPALVSRRKLLELSPLGFGSIALAHLLAEESGAKRVVTHNDLVARRGHFPARAKAVIQLVQNGGPSQMDLFDPKPMLAKYAGQPHPDGVEIHQPGNYNTLLPTPFEFSKHGESGMDVSEVLPHQAGIVDKLCFIRSMHTEHNNHLEGLNMLLTCKIFPGRPVMGCLDHLCARDGEPEPSGIRCAPGSEGLHDRWQTTVGERLPACVVPGR